MKIFKEMTTDKTRVCKCCGRELPIEAYATNPRFKGMKGLTCNECVTEKKRSTADRHAEIRAKRAEESARAKVAHLNRLEGIRQDIEEPRNGVGIYGMTTKELLDELKRRGFLYDRVAQDYREIYNK